MSDRCSPSGSARSSRASSRSTSRPGSRSARRRSSSGGARASRRRPCAHELAELERLGLLTHPHTSAGRVPTEAGYRVYVDELLARPEPRPGRFPLDLRRRARRGRGGAAGDDRDALAGDAAARARLGAAARGGDGPARRGAAAAAERRDGRRDHVDRRRHASSATRSPSRSTPGSSRGPATTCTSGSTGAAARLARCSRAPSTSRASSPRERAFLRVAPRRVRRASRRSGGSTSAARRGCSTTLRAEEIGAYRSLIDALEKRAALLDVLAQSLDPRRPFVRVGDELEQPGLHDLALVGATYGLRAPARSARSACSARCGWTTRRRSAPCASAAHELSRFVEEVYDGSEAGWRTRRDRDYYELLGVARDADERDDQEGVPPARARAAPGRLRASPDAEVRFREVSEAYEVLSNSETRAALRPLRARRPALRRVHADALRPRRPRRPLLARSSATTSSAAARAAARSARRRRRAPRSRSSSSTPRAGVEGRGPVRGRGHRARPAAATASSPGTQPLDLPALRAAAAACSRSRGASSASSSAAHACPECRGRGADHRAPVRGRAAARGARSRSATLEVDVPAGHPRRPAHPPLGRGPRRRARRPRGRRLRPRARPARPALRARGQRHLLAGRPDDRPGGARRDGRRSRRSTGRVELEFDAGHAAGRGARPARQGHARAAGLRPRRPPRARQRHRAAPAQRRAAPPARGVRARRATSDTYRHDEGFFEKLKSAFR